MAESAERARLRAAREGYANWKRWGSYVSLRAWGTVREDYSAQGSAWEYLPHDHARSRAYRWSEDGLAGICDRWQHLCFALALWNGRDPILKERLFGLTNNEGNHGEDVKEVWWPLDATPTHSWMRWLYRYPQAEFPYALLVEENRRRGRAAPEYELVDTGVFDDGRFFDVEVSYAKASPDDICIQIDCHNRGPDNAPLHVLPTVWFRNTWAWGRDARHPHLRAAGDTTVEIHHSTLGDFWLAADGDPQLLFTENETNHRRLFGGDNRAAYVKDGINDHVVCGAPTVNPARSGTKAAAWYRLEVPAGACATLRLRLADAPPDRSAFAAGFAAVMDRRAAEADEFYAELAAGAASADARSLQRRALAGLLWTKQYYHYHVAEWLQGDPAQPPPPPGRETGRNRQWTHLANTDIVSMPDPWEYPWYAAWDLAFHMIPFALVDADFAKEQLILLCREWYMHPNGQLPAYEWAFDDVNPPVHAWAAWRVFKIDARQSGTKDFEFLERVFHKLLLNFTWWVNRKDAEGDNVFSGGFLGLDNIGPFDRSQALPGGGRLEQADATSWMAMYCLNMLAIALELAYHDLAYEDIATKFFEHFLAIAHAINHIGPERTSLWDEAEGFYYDVVAPSLGGAIPVKVRSIVGIIPLFAVETIDPEVLAGLPDFSARVAWFLKHRPALCANVHSLDVPGQAGRRMLSILTPDRLRRVLARLLDEQAFLSPHGIRSLSREHLHAPVDVVVDGGSHRVAYEPAESASELFGGNSNWRGPVWFPINYLIVESLQKFHHYLGDDFTVEFPAGSGRQLDLWDVAAALSERLIGLFLPDAAGRRPVNHDRPLLDSAPHWRPHVTFNEYFHGDTGAGLGASQQTGWTALVAKLIDQRARHRPRGP